MSKPTKSKQGNQTPVILFRDEKYKEEDFLIPVPEFAERRGRQEHTDLRLFPSRRSGTRLARHFSDQVRTVRQEKDEEFRSILL